MSATNLCDTCGCDECLVVGQDEGGKLVSTQPVSWCPECGSLMGLSLRVPRLVAREKDLRAVCQAALDYFSKLRPIDEESLAGALEIRDTLRAAIAEVTEQAPQAGPEFAPDTHPQTNRGTR